LGELDYGHYGETVKVAGQTTDYRYAGMFYLPETGLYLTHNRLYDPDAKRWLNRDPIGEVGGLNLYAYVGGNPVNFVDLLGLDPGDIFPTPDEAAKDAGKYGHSQGYQRIEYGGWIYPQEEGFTYNFTTGAPTRIPREKLLNLKTKCPSLPVAIWHTHPIGLGSENAKPGFSGDDGDDPSGDKGFSREQGVPIYLRDRDGKDYVYDPKTKKTRRVR
jgi:RHS repeat-associated protein